MEKGKHVLKSVINDLQQWANHLDCHPCYDRFGRFDEAKYWKIRGSQKTLRLVARQIQALDCQGREEYLHCLMRDAQEFLKEFLKRRREPNIEYWQTEGEAYILPRIQEKLSRLLVFQNDEQIEATDLSA